MPYYKGLIASTSDAIQTKQFLLGKIILGDYSYFIIRLANNKRLNLYGGFLNKDNKFKSYFFGLEDEYQECKNEEIIDYLDELTLKEKIRFQATNKEIIYEKIKDEDGNEYAKELLTGLYFPIYDESMNEKKYYCKKTNLTNSIYVRMNDLIIVPNMDKCESIITEERVADNNEVLSYKEQFNKGSARKKKEVSFRKEIEQLYNKNVFKKELKFKQEEKVVKQKQNLETTMMENIEYLLQKLSSIDMDLYSEYLNQYNCILSSSDFTYMNLASLEGELEFHLMMGKTNAEDIIKYLENLKIEYLEEFLNDKKMSKDLSIKDIDHLEDIVLKTKDKYSLVTQRKVLKDLAFLYFLEVYQNKDFLNESDFSNSYFVDNLKTILIIIKSLINLGIIKNNVSIEMNDELSLKNVLDIISRIEFNKNTKEDVLKLVMTI